jgi:beta-glucosidase
MMSALSKKLPRFHCAGAFVVLSVSACASGPTYKNPAAPVEDRVADLLSRMTLEEKVSQLISSSDAVDRLDVPAYNWWNECLHGVARGGRATVFPQAIGMAATWDKAHMRRVADAISDEARARHHELFRRGKRDIYQGLTFWTPNINIFRDPRWGRGMETYGEDPYLTGKMAVELIKGLQGDDPKYFKTIATAKHFAVHSGPEPSRHVFDANVGDRDLWETYLPHFEMTVKEARVHSVMCAYNRFRGDAACASPFLLEDVLRKQWGFQGYVVSDCAAIRDIDTTHKIVDSPELASAMAVKSGCDLNCGVRYLNLGDAVEHGLINEPELDVSLGRLLEARFRLGLFDPDELVKWAAIPYSVNDSEEHRALALETARKSIVLLKNDDSLLPLAKDLGTIAVIGPHAAEVEALLANYNGDPSNPISPLAGIRDKLAATGTNVIYAQGSEIAANMPRFAVIPTESLFVSDEDGAQNGLQGEYYASNAFDGEAHRPRELGYPTTGRMVGAIPENPQPAFTRVDAQIDFNWWDAAPSDELDDDNFGVRWTGFIKPPVTGTYKFGALGFNAYNLSLDGKRLISYNNVHHPTYQYEEVELEAGKLYPVQLDFFETVNDAMMKLVWSVPGQERELASEAIAAARKADAVVMVMGLSPRLEGEEMRVPVEGFEGGDRLTLGLPDVQEELIQSIAGVGKPVVLVLLNGSAVAINWAAGRVPAIVEAWYPGQAGGAAIADVLFGDYNPAGRLPVTFYTSTDQLPPFEDYSMAGRTYRYFEETPLYPFGFGLSYTSFAYGNLQVPSEVNAGEDVAISVEVENTGERAGEEVVQLYIHDEEASTPRPIRSLQGFERIALEPGEKKTLKLTLTPKQLSMVDGAGRRVVEPGVFEIAVGGKQPGFTGRQDAHTTSVVTGSLTVVGEVTEIE